MPTTVAIQLINPTHVLLVSLNFNLTSDSFLLLLHLLKLIRIVLKGLVYSIDSRFISYVKDTLVITLGSTYYRIIYITHKWLQVFLKSKYFILFQVFRRLYKHC